MDTADKLTSSALATSVWVRPARCRCCRSRRPTSFRTGARAASSLGRIPACTWRDADVVIRPLTGLTYPTPVFSDRATFREVSLAYAMLRQMATDLTLGEAARAIG